MQEKSSLEQRIATLEERQNQTQAIGLALQQLVLGIMEILPDETVEEICGYVAAQHEHFQAFALNSTAASDDWLQLRQLAYETLMEKVNAGRPRPTA